MLLRRPFPLKWHLALLVVGMLLPVVLFTGIVLHRLAQSERAMAERRLMRSVRDLASLLDREMSGTIRTLSALAESERLDRGDLPAFYAEASRVLKTQPSWNGVILLSPDGQQLVNTGHPWGTKLPGANEPASLKRVVETGRPLVGDLVPGGLRRMLAFPVRVPVVRGGAVQYVLTAVMTPKALESLVAQQTSPNEEWTRTVVDGRGVVVARSRAPERFVGQSGTPSFLRLIREAPEALHPETTLDGKPVYLAFRRADLSGWTAVIGVPRDVVEGPARRSLLVVAGIGLALLTLSGLGASLFSRRLSRSLRSAALAADTLALGRRPEPRPSSVAELARLSEALERSAELLIWKGRQLNEQLARTEAARAEAETASRGKDHFMAMLGHELRNPLAPIRNGVYLLRELLPPDEKVERVRTMIERQLAHLTRLVDDLLDASRIERGKVVLQTQPLDLRLVVREAAGDFEGQLDRAGLAFHLTVPETPVRIEGDRTRLAQCLGNLLHNALKFTPAGGRVLLSLSVDGGLARIEIEDNGAGIDPALLPTLFQPFAQGPQPLDRSQGGLGLGLALVKGLVELHGGTVSVASAGTGLGTRIAILLPLAQPQAEEEPVLSAPLRLLPEVLPPGLGQGLHPDDPP
ncbi:MAG TPA: sensor histidine kinase [Thermoanaerobaculia bacterium]|nr:sensor histidine kinase [Thermoanaerobaculia bacterium]